MALAAKYIAYMLKAPIEGAVKTRLADALGKAGACAAYRRLVEHCIASTSGPWQRGVYYAPTEAERFMRDWLNDTQHFIAQPVGDLGDRMLAAVEDMFSRGAESVALLGGDCPYLDTALLLEAFTALNDHDLVIGPSTDGGYYTLLMKRVHRQLFENISWSTGSVLAETLQCAQALGLTVYLLPELEDVDELEAWERACQAYSTLRI